MSKKPSGSPAKDSRRKFLKKGALAAGALVTGVGSAEAAPKKVRRYSGSPAKGSVLGANDRLLVGHVGVGGQGFTHVRAVTNMNQDGTNWHDFEYNVADVAGCDLYSGRRDRVKDHLEMVRDAKGQDFTVEAHEDHRKLLENKDIDVIFIGAVDHWHAQIAIDAMEAGKHVYCEKPMTRYLGEAFGVYDAVKRTGMKFQIGSQYCSEAKWHQAAELVKAGKIGPATFAQNSYMRNSPDGEWNYYGLEEGVTTETLNWDHWLGQVAHKPDFNREHYHRWRKYYPYCAGILGDLLAHMIHPLVIAANITEMPKRVVCIGNKLVTDMLVGPDDRSVDDNTQLLAEFPSGLCMMIAGSTVNEQGVSQVIRGHEATLYFGGGSVELRPERPYADLVDAEIYENLTPGPDIPAHVDNLFSAIRNDHDTNGNIDVAIIAQAIISMAEASNRYGEAIYLKADDRTFHTGGGTILDVPTYGTFDQS
ncbi:MAG: Gfo/Idh/MocA family oxidoreductase [Bacteroidetes bacterium]|nr:Gfo/Idh/MocA family oxidoreductase [Bacteroidota bacterium]